MAAVPTSAWKDEILKPDVMCVKVNGECTDSSYPSLPGSIRVEAEVNTNETNVFPPGVNPSTGLVKLDSENVCVDM